MNEITTPGPAYVAAAWPVITKMPAPMIAPMPSAISCQGPRVRCSSCASFAATSPSVDIHHPFQSSVTLLHGSRLAPTIAIRGEFAAPWDRLLRQLIDACLFDFAVLEV